MNTPQETQRDDAQHGAGKDEAEAERIAEAFRELGWSNTAAGELAGLHINIGGPAL